MRPLKRYSKHTHDTAQYTVDFGPWLKEVGSTFAGFTQEFPEGLTVAATSSGSAVTLIVSGGIAGRNYVIAMDGMSASGLRQHVEIAVKVFGRLVAEVDPEDLSATMVDGMAPTVGESLPRSGSIWNYECLLVANAPGASATFRIRVGNSIDAATEFDVISVVVSATPSTDGKYRGTGQSDGSTVWLFHAADIVAISGAAARGSVTGVGV